jgi:dTDP-4-amino-4,6-dideoxygalactose transaminase
LSADAWKRFSDAGFKHYELMVPGSKYNMMDLQAAFGLYQLARVEANLERRRQIWARQDQAFADMPAFLPAGEEEGTRHARHLHTLLLDIGRLRADRDEIQAALHRQRIGTGIHYRTLDLHQYYREVFGDSPGNLTNAEWIPDCTLSLPLSPTLRGEDVESVILAVRRILEHFAR